MNELAIAYIKYLSQFKEVKPPKMPNFNLAAYTDNEYLLAIDAIMFDFNKFDDLVATEKFLKGD